MTQPQTVERRRKLPVRQRPAALAAVCAGRLLAHLPPRRIRAVLTLLRRRAAPATYQQARDAHDAILSTSVRCGGRHCLQRSLATVVLCRIRGVWPTWCIGVRTAPFVAHAWVEAEDHPVGEPHSPDRYRRLIVIPPSRAQAPQGDPVP
ncbi:MAG: lasso peptide biosynthesis B2 protein [Pseudonocardiales bacterium]|nr:lasso peptide biosynthesis B2 protein [Pseudonocardiales bacterium]